MPEDVLRCRLCRTPLQYVHGHAACLMSRCPMFGLNQGECCDGETDVQGCVGVGDIVAPRRTDD